MPTVNAPHRARILLIALLVLFGAYWVGARFGPHQPINVGAVPSASAPANSAGDTPAHLTNAQRDAVLTDDESIKTDGLAVMEDAMAYFYRLALKERHRNGDADPKAIRDNLREAVTIAKEVAPYRHARLSSVKVGTDRANAQYVPDGVTAAEVREELFSMIARSGVLPTAMSERLQRAEALLEHQGVVNRGDSSEDNN